MGIGMGKLDPDQKYVVLFEVYGPNPQAVGDAFDQELSALMTKYGGQIKHTWHASKSIVDQQGYGAGVMHQLAQQLPSARRSARRRMKGKRPQKGPKKSSATD